MQQTLQELAYLLARKHYKAAALAVFSELEGQFSSEGFDAVHYAARRGMHLYVAALGLAEKIWAGSLPYEKAELALYAQFKEFGQATCALALEQAYEETR